MPARTILVFLFLGLIVVLTAPRIESQLSLTFTAINVRSSTHVEANGVIPSGEIVGFYVDGAHVEHGFKDVCGAITAINFPGSTGTRAYGLDINNIFTVGTYTDSKSATHGFELNNNTGKFTSIDVPGAASTRALSVNSLGTIVGAYTDAAGATHGFLDKNGSGGFTTLDFTGASLTEVHGIVNLRYMAGIFIDAAGMEHGVQGADGELGAPVNVPGAVLTSADGVNNAVNFVGHYGPSPAGPFHGYFLSGGQFQTIDFPGATDTRCNGVSDTLEAVGRYTDAHGVIHGFLVKGL